MVAPQRRLFVHIATKPFIAACISALLVHPIVAVAEELPGVAAWLSGFYLLLGVWAYSLLWLWRAERKASVRLAVAIVAGAVAFGLLVPQAFAFTGWSVFGFAP